MTYEIQFFTWLGAVLFAFCGLPQAVAAWRKPETTRGLSWWFLGSWFLAELCMFAGLSRIASLHVLCNYVINVVLISYMAGVKYTLPSGAEH